MSTPDSTDITDDGTNSRLVSVQGDAEAELVYEVERDRLLLLHTGVPDEFRGQGMGGRLVSAAVAKASSEDLTIVPWCPYARKWLQDHSDVAAQAKIDFSTPRPK